MDYKIIKGKSWPYGLTVHEGGVNLSLDIPTDNQALSIRIVNFNDRSSKTSILKDEWYDGRLWTLDFICKDPETYGFQILKGNQPVLLDYGREVCKIGREYVYLFKTHDFDWMEDSFPNLDYDDLYIYKMHIRGFTKHKSSGVQAPGTFEGALEKLSYLQSLGINAIELMPVYNFKQYLIDKQTGEEKENYWGYGPASYFTPKPEYAMNPEYASEGFKKFIRECHRMQIEVYMEIHFEERLTEMCKMMCLHYWVQEYHVDGFHLNSEEVSMKAVLEDPILSNTKMMAQDFDGSSDQSSKKRRRAVYHNGFLEVMRQFLRGGEDSGRGFMEKVIHYSVDQGCIQYLTGHNGFTLMDLVSYDRKHNENNGEHNRDGAVENLSWNCGEEGPSRKKSVLKLRRQQIKNACILNIFHHGTPLIYQGDEFGNSQKGNNNAWCQDNAISWLDWRLLDKNRWIYDFIRELIRLRKEHPCLNPHRAFSLSGSTANGFPEFSFHGRMPWYVDENNGSPCIGCMYVSVDEVWYFAYNMTDIKEKFSIPILMNGKKWKIVIDTADMYKKDECVQDTLLLEQHSIIIVRSLM